MIPFLQPTVVPAAARLPLINKIESPSVRAPDPNPRHFSGQPFPQDYHLITLQKATIRLFLGAEILFICTKYRLYGLLSKTLFYNSQKNASIRKPVFQNGLRSPIGAIYAEMISQEFAGLTHTRGQGISRFGNFLQSTLQNLAQRGPRGSHLCISEDGLEK